MKSAEADFRKVAPGIDRLFRFIEMIGITALLSTIFPIESPAIRLVGSELALYYLLEPAIDAFSFWMVPEVNRRQDVARITVLGFVAIIGIFLSLGVVSNLSERISRTITFSPA